MYSPVPGIVLRSIDVIPFIAATAAPKPVLPVVTTAADVAASISSLWEFISPGIQDIQFSYRSELSGILGELDVLNELCIKQQITQGKTSLGCDNRSAIDVVHIKRKLVSISSKWKHSDLISAIIVIIIIIITHGFIVLM